MRFGKLFSTELTTAGHAILTAAKISEATNLHANPRGVSVIAAASCAFISDRLLLMMPVENHRHHGGAAGAGAGPYYWLGGYRFR